MHFSNYTLVVECDEAFGNSHRRTPATLLDPERKGGECVVFLPERAVILGIFRT